MDLSATNFSGIIRDMRHMIRTNASARFKGSLDRADDWYQNMSPLIDAMLVLQVSTLSNPAGKHWVHLTGGNMFPIVKNMCPAVK